MNHRRRNPDEGDGSPDPDYTHTLHQAATDTSLPENMSGSSVPLYLVPQAVAAEIRRHGSISSRPGPAGDAFVGAHLIHLQGFEPVNSRGAQVTM